MVAEQATTLGQKPPILTVEGVKVEFSGFQALRGVDLQVHEGEVVGLIGPNGAGKSTLLNTIAGRVQASGGRIVFRGVDVTHMRASDRPILGMCLKLQLTSVFLNETVLGNMLLAAQPKRQLLKAAFRRYDTRAVQERVEQILHLTGLAGMEDVPARNLSHGQQQWLEIGMVLSSGAVMLLLDEPTAGMSREETQRTLEIINRIKKDHAVLVVEHDIDFVKGVSDRIVVLHQGAKIADGPVSEVEKNELVRQVYLRRREE